MILALGFTAVLLLAFANGANDNSKPVATLAGAGLAAPRRVLAFGAMATLLGAFSAILLGKALAATFSAKGLVGSTTAANPAFLSSVAAGAAATVLLATRIGLPISTTHALIGAMVGAGLVAGAVDLLRLGLVFCLPLLTSPLLAFGATALAYPILRAVRRRYRVKKESCLCVGEALQPAGRCGGAAVAAASLKVVLGREEECADPSFGRFVDIRAGRVATGMHWASAMALAFGRGLQDASKIAGLGIVLAGAAFSFSTAAAIALLMAAGGLLFARRVERTMAGRIATMNEGEALTANWVASSLVLAASGMGLPVSTTHVTTGAVAGLRVHGARPDQSWIGRILLAWVLTLPLAAGLAAALLALLR